ncbi:MAG: HlyD family efflux transporter periplasmic adaptor subunit [Phycisphaeraceae bacterium]
MHDQTTASAQPNPADLVADLSGFEGPPAQFLNELLRVQCRIGGAEQGAILRRQGEGGSIVAMHPPRADDQPAPSWLAQAMQAAAALKGGESQILPVQQPGGMYGVQAEAYLVLLALSGGAPGGGAGGVRGVATFFIRQQDSDEVNHSRRQLELTASLLDNYEMRLTLRQRQQDLKRLSGACSVLSEVNGHERFQAAAMALCNQLASSIKADRVSFGLLRGRYVKTQAMSHTEKLVRKMDLVQAIEAAMEEALDQDIEVPCPDHEQSTVISRSAAELSRRFGPSCILSVPMRQGGEVRGVVTVERPEESPFTPAEVEALRLTVELATPRLIDLAEHDRWAGARLVRSCRSGLATLVGPHYTWVKLAAIGVLAFLAFAIFAQGTYRVEAPFTVEASQGQVLAAPFAGFVHEVGVRPGDAVTAGQTLGSLDTLELRNDLVTALAELEEQVTRANIARAEGETAEQRIAEAGADRVQARIDRVRWRLSQAEIQSRIAGIVLTTGDLHKEIGRPVEAGESLFEIAPLEQLEIQLAVPEAKIAELAVGQTGELASTSHPGTYVPFTITRIEPMAQLLDQRNIFRVQAELEEHPDWLRPNMEGAAKVDIDERSYAWIWTHEIVNWVRMKLWL